MLGSAVPLVHRKPIGRIDEVVLAHQAVACDLCDNRGRGNGCGKGVALDNRTLRDGVGGQANRIEQEEIRRGSRVSQRSQRAPHGQAGGLQNIDAINFFGVGTADTDRTRTGLNDGKQLFPALSRELLAVVQSWEGTASR